MAKTKNIREMRIQARKLGITNARELDPDELAEAIEDAKGSNGNGAKTKKKATKAVKTVIKKRGRPKKVRDEDEEETPKKKRGRPPGSGKKATTTAKAKKPNAVGRPVGSGTGTRVLVPDRIKWNRPFDFREGSQSQYILNELRKAAKKYTDTADIREAVMEKLEGKLNKVDELTFMNRETGKPHKGDKALAMLRYRVNRCILDYCINTDQHDGATASSTKSKSSSTTTTKKRGRPRKVVEEDDDDEDEGYDEDEDDDEDEPVVKKKKRGRPAGSKNKTAAKRGPGRPRKDESAPKKRGRPPGTKNKVKTGEKRRGRPPGSKNKTK